jgi:DNA-binding NtrC family response regulator
MSGDKVLVVDDDALIITVLSKALKVKGYRVYTENGANNLLNKIKSWSPDVLLLDINLPGKNGLEILEEIKRNNIDAEVVMLTADDTAETAIKAMKLGAVDYLIKPFDIDEVTIVVGNTIKNKKLKNEVDYYRQICSPMFEKELIGGTDSIKELKERIWKIVEAGISTILITGENGTGKEVVARYIHRLRYGGCTSGYAPFIAVNCAALPEAILESELFGYEKGSFTDAKFDKKGLFEAARGGSILLDEIGEMKLELQGKLLRVLEERTIRRIGGKEDISLNATVIATTNSNLSEAVTKGEFRMDLFYRLNGFALQTKPLRELREDIPVLAEHFLSTFSEKYNKKNVKKFSPEAVELMKSHYWRGNIRELKNLVERVVVLEQAEVITPENLPFGLDGSSHVAREGRNGCYFILPDGGISMEDLEKNLITQALRKCNDNKAQAAKLLDISYNAIRWQVRKFGLD